MLGLLRANSLPRAWPPLCFNPAVGGLSSSGTFLLGFAGTASPIFCLFPAPWGEGRGVGTCRVGLGRRALSPGQSWLLVTTKWPDPQPVEADRERSSLVVRKTPSDREPQQLEAEPETRRGLGWHLCLARRVARSRLPPGARVGLVAGWFPGLRQVLSAPELDFLLSPRELALHPALSPGDTSREPL